jgi:hypothetical protein
MGWVKAGIELPRISADTPDLGHIGAHFPVKAIGEGDSLAAIRIAAGCFRRGVAVGHILGNDTKPTGLHIHPGGCNPQCAIKIHG